MDNLDELRQHYDETDQSADLKAAIDDGTAQWDETVDEDPMVGTSLRLQRSLLQRIRSLAGRKQMPTTMFMRSLLVKALAEAEPRTADPDRIAAEMTALRSQVDELRDLVLSLREDLRRMHEDSHAEVAPAREAQPPPSGDNLVVGHVRSGKTASWLDPITGSNPQILAVDYANFAKQSKPVKIKYGTVRAVLRKADKKVTDP